MTEEFYTDTQFTHYTENTAGTFSVADNQATITHTTGTHNNIVTETVTELAIPQCFISIQVDQGGSGSSGYDCAGVGLFKDANNFVCAVWDRINNIARIQVKTGGTNYNLGSVSKSGWTAPYKVGFSLVGNSACFWKNDGSGWYYVTGVDTTSYYNLKTSGNLADYKYGFVVASNCATTWKFSSFKEGGFGCVGLRDICCVSDIYGTAYISNNELYVTATAPDPRGSSYSGVFKIDLDTYAITQLGVMFISRDGAIQNDVSSHIIRYDNGDRRLTIATWGNGFGGEIKVLSKLLEYDDILSDRYTLVTDMTELDLPGLLTEDYGAEEGHIVWDSANSRWLIAYSITEDTSFVGDPFYAAMAYSTDLSTWNLIGADTENQGWEGARMLYEDGAWWLLTGGPCRGPSTTARIYDQNMNFIDTLDVTFDGGTVTQPHPMLFYHNGVWKIITFNQTKYGSASFTWGHVQIFTSSPSASESPSESPSVSPSA